MSLADELRHPVFAPFVALIPIVGLLLGITLFIDAIAVRTVLGPVRGTFLPRVPA